MKPSVVTTPVGTCESDNNGVRFKSCEVGTTARIQRHGNRFLCQIALNILTAGTPAPPPFGASPTLSQFIGDRSFGVVPPERIILWRIRRPTVGLGFYNFLTRAVQIVFKSRHQVGFRGNGGAEEKVIKI